MTKIDWQKEVDKRKEQLMDDLKTLIRIDSVRDLEHQTEAFPLGPGPAEALSKFLEIGERDGFVTKNIENVAGHIEYGEGEDVLGVLAHVDVVPTGDGWETDPFDPVIKDGKLYARGSSDDKGPAIAAYYALKIIKELELPVSKKVRYIIGTDEESGWYCMERYQANETMPNFGFSPDAHFPIINGEKGIASFVVTFEPINTAGAITLRSFQSGLRSNMVPGDGTAIISGDPKILAKLKQDFDSYITEHHLAGQVEIEGDQGTIHLIGKAAHAQNPVAGINAATYLADALKSADLDGAGKAYLTAISTYLHQDPQGKLTDIAHTDEIMGELTSSPNLFVYDEKGPKTVTINVRYPKGTDAEKIAKAIAAAIPNVTVAPESGVKTPHYVPADDPLVVALLGAYEEHTGEKGREKTIGGGTYGRLFERGVAFGALFPGREDVMHQANEFMYVEDIYKATVIYADAIYRLIH
ncbi:dipeptidase PepV [uncultured Vagococcus sp.]|uniref:dipeptidase PepV n=1 Tax=uncultured Vagococcus sp. TaxID=189676 RepID=UPI0028D3168D|nr:dipeptidase PepV [uncultured Vagococcus sp.]